MSHQDRILQSKNRRPDLTKLTPVEANYIVTHFIHSVNPTMAEGLEVAAPTVRHYARISGHGLSMMKVTKGEPPREESDLFSHHFRSHFLDGFDGAESGLDALAWVICHYAMASTGSTDLTAKHLQVYNEVLGDGWRIIDAAKKNPTQHVRNQALMLENAIMDYYQRLPGQKFYRTSDSTQAR